MSNFPVDNAGFGTPLRIIAALAVLALALLGVLVTVDVVPLERFGALMGKVVLIACIVGLASIALGFLAKSGRS
ncbi:MAG: hypothetical protein IT495_19390 [Gammaproteobacteria bacterium]|nr:hypothetical protein [Gammaproteobacteria bacterium]